MSQSFNVDVPVEDGQGATEIPTAYSSAVSAAPADGQDPFSVSVAGTEAGSRLEVSGAPADAQSVKVTVTVAAEHPEPVSHAFVGQDNVSEPGTEITKAPGRSEDGHVDMLESRHESVPAQDAAVPDEDAAAEPAFTGSGAPGQGDEADDGGQGGGSEAA
jgi:hypothetical protein